MALPGAAAPPGQAAERRLSAPARRWRTAGTAVLAVLLAFLALYALRAPLLTGVARLLTVRDPVSRADFIFVLGGEPYVRPRHAAALYRRGVAPRVVIPREELTPVMEMGLVPNGTDVVVEVLRRSGVPDSAIVVLERAGGAGSTADEARLLRQHLERTGARRVVAVTEEYHSRRARWVLRRRAEGLPAEVRLSPAESRGFDESDWWRSERGLITYVNEYIKFGFYLVNHR